VGGIRRNDVYVRVRENDEEEEEEDVFITGYSPLDW